MGAVWHQRANARAADGSAASHQHEYAATKYVIVWFSGCANFYFWFHSRRNDAAEYDECSPNGTATTAAYATNGNAATDANDATTWTHDKCTRKVWNKKFAIWVRLRRLNLFRWIYSNEFQRPPEQDDKRNVWRGRDKERDYRERSRERGGDRGKSEEMDRQSSSRTREEDSPSRDRDRRRDRDRYRDRGSTRR